MSLDTPKPIITNDCLIVCCLKAAMHLMKYRFDMKDLQTTDHGVQTMTEGMKLAWNQSKVVTDDTNIKEALSVIKTTGTIAHKA